MRGALVPLLALWALLACSPAPGVDAGMHDDAGGSLDGGSLVDAAVIDDAAARDGSTATHEDGGAVEDDDAGDTLDGGHTLDAGSGVHDGGTAAVCDPEATPNAGIVEPMGSGGCPPGTVLVAGEGFCVDRFEAFLVEWTADPAGTFRGGFFVDTRINGEGCLYSTTAHSMAYWDYSTGFRCCADP